MTPIRSFKRIAAWLTLFSCALGACNSVAHNWTLRGKQVLPWNNPQIKSVTSVLVGQSTSLAESLEIDGMQCVRASTLALDVHDDIAFDIDEKVELQLLFHRANSAAAAAVIYDVNAPRAMHTQLVGNGVGMVGVGLGFEPQNQWFTQTVALKRARFAGLGPGSSDIVLAAAPGPDAGNGPPVITLCDLRIIRSYSTPQHRETGKLELRVVDQSGAPVPARIGLYDSTGRTPLPSSEAVPIQWNRDIRSLVEVTPGYVDYWPSDNIRVFYIDGDYGANLPVGDYRLLVSRGPQYRVEEASITIKDDESTHFTVEPQDWTANKLAGWLPGDTHLHIARNGPRSDQSISRHLAAEGIAVGHLLQMGDLKDTFFHHYRWGSDHHEKELGVTLVNGQEDPRTALLGHLMGLGGRAWIRKPESYYHYLPVIRGIRDAGGLVGYAHLRGVPGGRINPLYGLALDVPTHNIDFVELLSSPLVAAEKAQWPSKTWFDFLNLGFRLTPAGGSDYMDNANHPGAVRTYAYVGETHNREQSGSQEWLSAFKQGRVFVTSGPVIDMKIDGQAIGDTLSVRPNQSLQIKVSAAVNDQVDLLQRLDVYHNGRLMVSERPQSPGAMIELQRSFTATEGGWLVAVAYGAGTNRWAHSAAAVTAPVYYETKRGGTCDPSQAEAIALSMKQRLAQLRKQRVVNIPDVRPWVVAGSMAPAYEKVLPKIHQRIAESERQYDHIIRQARAGLCRAEV
ncbi:CehA/McbA family metallohydrolase [Pseudomaricurvus alkylphenolicus]|uniref:CehA/McbA family metallohydrolase n=1 Tax=Pseudomaricurvus alkylphenolicus TaxID=1306991 RepID=UPI00141DA83C|nr:CehA/McbA family metallohydrolase [Pseudomaricurvus alkylphenolicus]NIB42494.1 CehA/McbA family metallohydrolase [Pseudomaricurvus alkylphenolicus]